jgi:hypothetical protein
VKVIVEVISPIEALKKMLTNAVVARASRLAGCVLWVISMGAGPEEKPGAYSTAT